MVQLLIHTQTSVVQPLKFGNGCVISSHNLLGMWLLMHVGIKIDKTPGHRQNSARQVVTCSRYRSDIDLPSVQTGLHDCVCRGRQLTSHPTQWWLSLLTPQKTEETARHLRQYASMHYNDVRMDVIASQITSLTIVYSTVYSGADQRKHQRSASLAFVRGIHRRPVNFPHKWPVTRKMFPLDDVIMIIGNVPQTDTLGAGQNGRNFCKRHFQIHLLEKKSMNFYHE